MKVSLSKILPVLSVRIQLLYPKKFGLGESVIGIIRALFIMPTTFVGIGIDAVKRMSVQKLSSAGLNAPPALPVTKHVRTSSRNAAHVWIGRLMSAMAVIKK
jgi:hypothetical protein